MMGALSVLDPARVVMAPPTKVRTAVRSPRSAAAIGVPLGWLPSPYAVGVLAEISSSGTTTAQGVVALVAFTVLSRAVALLPMACFRLSPARTRELVGRLYAVLRRYRRATLLTIGTVSGNYLLRSGLQAL